MTIQLHAFKDEKTIYELNPESFKYVVEYEDYNGYIMERGTKILVKDLGVYIVAETWEEVVQAILDLDTKERNDET